MSGANSWTKPFVWSSLCQFFFKIHNHPSRQGHSPSALAVPVEVPTDTPVPRHTMELFAVLCIQTSHYVSFVKYGSDAHSWIFFDSMADRCGEKDFCLCLFRVFSDVRANTELIFLFLFFLWVDYAWLLYFLIAQIWQCCIKALDRTVLTSLTALYHLLGWCLILRLLFLIGDDQSGYNIPEVRACPELGDFLSQPEEELSQANPSQAPELVRRLLCDSYMFLYQSSTTCFESQTVRSLKCVWRGTRCSHNSAFYTLISLLNQLLCTLSLYKQQELKCMLSTS